MSIVRYTAEQVAAKGRVRRTKLRRTTEAEIARHAAHDRSSTAHIDFAAALKSGKLRKVDPPYQNRPQKKDSRGAAEPRSRGGRNRLSRTVMAEPARLCRANELLACEARRPGDP